MNLNEDGVSSDEFDLTLDHSNTMKPISIRKIKDSVVGLEAYEDNITGEMVFEYYEQTSAHTDPTIGPWFFLVTLFLFLINIYGKYEKSFSLNEYKMMKIADTVLNMRAFDYPSVDFIPPAKDSDF